MKTESDTQVYTFRLAADRLSVTDVAGRNMDAVSNQLPDGAYTTLRTFEGDKFLRLDAHLNRLAESAGVLGRPLALDLSRLRQALADVLARTGFPESRLRITTPLDGECMPDAFISVEPFNGIDPELYEVGVRAITMLIARASPKAKATGFIAPSRMLKAGLPREVYEVLMVTGDGRILEGFTSNFFAFVGGRLYTAEEGVLEGITRSIVLDLAETLFPVERCAHFIEEIPQFDEAFITSSSRAILPVVVIDEQVIGGGEPGPLTQQLRRRYDEYVAGEVEPPVQ